MYWFVIHGAYCSIGPYLHNNIGIMLMTDDMRAIFICYLEGDRIGEGSGGIGASGTGSGKACISFYSCICD